MSRIKTTDIFFISGLLFISSWCLPVQAAGSVKAKPDTLVYEQQLQEVIKLAEAGAPGLALHKMDQIQPQILPNPPIWIKWEKQRLELYKNNHNWRELINRVSQHKDTLPVEFRRQADTQKVDAYLALRQGTRAREDLRRLILSASGEEEKNSLNWIQQWRRMMVHSYIAEGVNEDALIAILRFQQDYAIGRQEVLFLRAKILLLNKRPAEAAELLSKHTKQPEAGMLYLLAQLRSEERSPVKVMQAGLRHLRGKWAKNKKLKAFLWAVVAEAAMRTGDRGTVVNAVEHVVADSSLHDNQLFDIKADNLWNAYIDYALHAGNKARLLIGQDKSWFNFAEKSGKKYPIRQRAVYALLMHRGSSEEDRLRAAKLFIKSAQKRRNNSYLIQQLFSKSQFYPALSDVPEPVRRAMVDIALARKNIPLASQIMATLKEPPKGKASYMWQLRRARILILGGKPGKGARALAKFTTDYPKAKRVQIDRFLQVVFDLQTVGEHDSAYRLFNDVINVSKDERLHRELYYWMADSRNAQQQYNEAAELYLKSAMLLDGKGWDPWGQTARYQAAKALGKAGHIEDAYYIYQRLLKVTKEEDRRAVLRYEVQKLQLARTGDSEEESESEQLMEQVR